INYLFRSSSAGSNGSDIVWSGNVSTSLYTDKFKFGLSLNDFNSPYVQPVDYRIRIYRYLTLHAEKTFELTAQTDLVGSFRSHVNGAGGSTASAHLGIAYNKIVGFHTFFHSSQGWGCAFDLPHIPMSEREWLDLSIAYKVSYSQSGRPPYNALEVNMAYLFSKAE
ncbi:MAG TPA: hypothetical protein VL947_01605, partial [Cytophagales bacterium]|nr:hypothetical protein [Cytophagales bacterium]